MPFIVYTDWNWGTAVSRLELIKLYSDLFQAGLSEAAEQIDALISGEKRYLIPIAEADVSRAAHCVYQARKFGIVCELRSAS